MRTSREHAGPHPRLPLYVQAVQARGEGYLADWLLEHWMNDPHAGTQWENLWVDIHSRAPYDFEVVEAALAEAA